MATMSEDNSPKARYMPPENNEEAVTLGALSVKSKIAYPEEGMNHILLTGAKATEYSYDAHFDKPMGALTYYATQIIDDNPEITYKELYAKLKRKLPSGRYPQTPQLEGTKEMKNSKIF